MMSLREAGFCPAAGMTVETAEQMMRAGQFADALHILLPALQREPDNLRVLDMSATCYIRLGDSATAAQLLEFLLDRVPESAPAWGKLAAVRAIGGDRAGALEAYRSALSFSPDDVELLAAANLLDTFGADSQEAASLRMFCSDPGSPDARKVLAHFALGKIEEAAGNHKAAFEHFEAANSLKAGGYDRRGQEEKLRAQLDAVWDVPEIQEESGKPKMLFVTGLPRSGTTLVESCLTRHADVGSIGESDALSHTAAAAHQYSAQKYGSTGWWNWHDCLDNEDVEQFRQLFWQRALNRGDPDRRVVIDKLPLNCFEMGFAQFLLPDAKFLFMCRNPLDTGLSIYKANFANGHGYACDLKWIGHMTGCVYRSVQDYQGKLGPALRVQSYQALVTDPDTQIRAMLAHADVEWDQNCLTPELNDRVVPTASFLQVREKIHTGALGKWKPYAEQLAPLKAELGGGEWLAKWQTWDQCAARTGRFYPETA